ncbi:hypothetical protein T12_7170, partial [Trichinella patagoniensis]
EVRIIPSKVPVRSSLQKSAISPITTPLKVKGSCRCHMNQQTLKEAPAHQLRRKPERGSDGQVH